MPEPTDRPRHPRRPLGSALRGSPAVVAVVWQTFHEGGDLRLQERPGPRYARTLGRGHVPHPYPTDLPTRRAATDAARVSIGPGRN